MKALLIIYILVPSTLFCQPGLNGNWTWMNGSRYSNQPGVYGTLGVPSATNTPGARGNTLAWTDSNGMFWLYGGNSSNTPFDQPMNFNDLWNYNLSTFQWTWLAGLTVTSDSVLPVYGQKGVASPSNTPGGRSSCFTWTASDGTLWFYDPSTTEFWNYNTVNGQWTWEDGDKNATLPVYGNQEIANTANTPGSRLNAACWTDQQGNLWLMSGWQQPDDLWKYDIKKKNWAWMKGSNNQVAGPFYGSIGTENTNNTPGNRQGSFTWTDNLGNLWLMGGYVFDSLYGTNLQNDLWRFNITTNNWAWMKGDSASLQPPSTVYNTEGVESPDNTPGGHAQGITWVDNSGCLWLMAGFGAAFPGDTRGSTLNELWRFNTTSLNWAWVRGNIDSTNYGTIQIPSPLNIPGTRMNTSQWQDKNGNLWMFGGLTPLRSGGLAYFNDLWRYSSNNVILAERSISFEAQRKNTNAVLTWSLNDEKGLMGYNVFRRDLNATTFTHIGYVTTGSSIDGIYRYNDPNNASSITFYRIQAIYHSGQSIFSEIRSVPGIATDASIVIYPNPSFGEAINVLFGDNNSKNINLVSANGTIINRWFNYTGNRLTLENLAAGTYMLQVVNNHNDAVKTRKFVVVK